MDNPTSAGSPSRRPRASGRILVFFCALGAAALGPAARRTWGQGSLAPAAAKGDGNAAESDEASRKRRILAAAAAVAGVEVSPAPDDAETAAVSASPATEALGAAARLLGAGADGAPGKAAEDRVYDLAGELQGEPAVAGRAPVDLRGTGPSGGSSASVGAPASAPRASEQSPRAGTSLYDALHPDRYDVNLAVDPAAGTFTGKVTIQAELARDSDEVTLHAVDLEVRGASVNGVAVDPKDILARPGDPADPAAGTVTLRLGRAFPAGAKLALSLEYAGRLNRQMKGLYQSTARFDGKEEKYAFTQFEPADFRRMAPSIDEPRAKAAFRLTVTAPKGLTVLSNMPPLGPALERGDGTQTVSFAETPRMSTYLLALAVARLAPGGTATVGKTRITVWSTPDAAGQTAFALASAKAALGRLNEYFALPYQLSKLDLVAVPDFAAGAMENWGAIFFRDSAILVDPKLSSTRAQRRVGMVAAHEIVHQWFGDLVTMKDWGGLWLNEAFAEWMGYKTIDRWKPGWRSWYEFGRNKQEALEVDALKNTRPVESKVTSVAEAEAQFDTLTYQKGGSVLRMLENFLGEDKFRDGIRTYMSDHKFHNTEAADLWSALEKASGVPVRQMAKDWLTQPGYPVVRVASASKDNRRITLSQRPFGISGPKDGDARWAVPVVLEYKVAGEAKPRTLRVVLKDGRTTVALPAEGRVEWVYPNQREIGYYRSEVAGRLGGALRGPAAAKLRPEERAGLLNDLWWRSAAGDARIDAALGELRAMKGERSRPVLEEMGARLTELSDQMIRSNADRAALSRFARDLLGRQWRGLGWEARPGKTDETKLARATLLTTLAAVAPSKELASEVRRRVDRYIADAASIDASLAAPLLKAGARSGDARLFHRYQEQFAKASNPEIRIQGYLAAMTQFRQPALANELLQMTLTDQIRGQDAWMPIAGLLENSSTQGAAWDFVRAHWPEIRRKVGDDKGADRIIRAMGSMWREDRRKEILDFFGDPANRVPAAERTLAQTLERIDAGIRFKNAESPRLSRWLGARYAPAD